MRNSVSQELLFLEEGPAYAAEVQEVQLWNEEYGLLSAEKNKSSVFLGCCVRLDPWRITSSSMGLVLLESLIMKHFPLLFKQSFQLC